MSRQTEIENHELAAFRLLCGAISSPDPEWIRGRAKWLEEHFRLYPYGMSPGGSPDSGSQPEGEG